MKKIVLPQTNLTVSQLGFGTASLHHLMKQEEREKLLNSALELGFTHFDTAPLYGEGLAESTLGKFFRSKRNNITLATKVGIPTHPVFRLFPMLMYGKKLSSSFVRRYWPQIQNSSYQLFLEQRQVENSLRNSLKALRTDWLDILFIHEPRIQYLPQLMNLAQWIERLKREGVIRYSGLAGKAEECLSIVQEIPNTFDILQVEDSIINREADALIDANLTIQITFGYLRNCLVDSKSSNICDVVRQSLQRNPYGMILVSSRDYSRLEQLSLLTGE